MGESQTPKATNPNLEANRQVMEIAWVFQEATGENVVLVLHLQAIGSDDNSQTCVINQ